MVISGGFKKDWFSVCLAFVWPFLWIFLVIHGGVDAALLHTGGSFLGESRGCLDLEGSRGKDRSSFEGPSPNNLGSSADDGTPFLVCWVSFLLVLWCFVLLCFFPIFFYCFFGFDFWFSTCPRYIFGLQATRNGTQSTRVMVAGAQPFQSAEEIKQAGFARSKSGRRQD